MLSVEDTKEEENRCAECGRSDCFMVEVNYMEYEDEDEILCCRCEGHDFDSSCVDCRADYAANVADDYRDRMKDR